VTQIQEIGGLAGRVLLALLVIRIASRRKLLRVFQIPGLIVMPVVFAVFAVHSLPLLGIGIFVAGMLTVGQFSFWGNYLPRVYPVHLRGTGEGFAPTSEAAWWDLLCLPDQLHCRPTLCSRRKSSDQTGFHRGRGCFAVFAAGFALSFLLPEPGEQVLPE